MSVTELDFPVSAIPASLGDMVAAERANMGWTQQRLADEAGLQRHTVMRLEAGRRPVADTVFRLEAALDLEPGTLVPGWPEWKPIGSLSLGSRSRERRRELGLSVTEVAADAGVGIATLSRFERELGAVHSLARYEWTEGLPEAVGIARAEYSSALGFTSTDEHEGYCRKRD